MLILSSENTPFPIPIKIRPRAKAVSIAWRTVLDRWVGAMSPVRDITKGRIPIGSIATNRGIKVSPRSLRISKSIDLLTNRRFVEQGNGGHGITLAEANRSYPLGAPAKP